MGKGLPEKTGVLYSLIGSAGLGIHIQRLQQIFKLSMAEVDDQMRGWMTKVENAFDAYGYVREDWLEWGSVIMPMTAKRVAAEQEEKARDLANLEIKDSAGKEWGSAGQKEHWMRNRQEVLDNALLSGNMSEEEYLRKSDALEEEWEEEKVKVSIHHYRSKDYG